MDAKKALSTLATGAGIINALSGNKTSASQPKLNPPLSLDYRARLRFKSLQSIPGLKELALGKTTTGVRKHTLFNSEKNSEGVSEEVIGILFPYTPTLTFGATADYSTYDITHTNYKYNAWIKSAVNEIQVDAMFTAQTFAEAQNLLLTLHLLKNIHKGNWGEENINRGSPPPIMLFDYLGEMMFKNVPVIVKSYSYTLDNNVDYVPVRAMETSEDVLGYVPSKMSISIILDVQYTPSKIRKEFSTEKFIKGELGSKGFL